MAQTQDKRLPVALLTLRLGVFIVMLMWTLDKFVQPGHAAHVFNSFYGLSGLGSTLFMVLGALQLLLVFAFLFGVAKGFSYGLIFVLHGISTLSAYAQYLDPYSKVNLLFFAAWPMLAACFTLYYLRDQDTLMTLDQFRGR